MNQLKDLEVHTCNPNFESVEARGSQIWGQPQVHCESLSRDENKTKQAEQKQNKNVKIWLH